MKITKAESVAILIAGMLLSLAVGFFLGRNTVRDAVVIEAMTPEPSMTVFTETPSPLPVVTHHSDVTAGAHTELSKQESSAVSSGLLNLNTATVYELQSLPDIGPVLAQRIIDYRESNGGFLSVEELKNVDGIGDKIFSSVMNYVEVVN